MGLFSKVEHKMEDAVENAGDALFDSPISPVQIAKKCEKFMKRNKMVGAGKQYAPTLYTILVNEEDDHRLFSFYPTLAGETETYLRTAALNSGLEMDGQPLVRFFADSALKHGKFDVFAQVVAAPIVEKLREEEHARYGISPKGGARGGYSAQAGRSGRAQQAAYDDYNQNGYAYDDAYGNADDSYSNPHNSSYDSYDEAYGQDAYDNGQNYDYEQAAYSDSYSENYGDAFGDNYDDGYNDGFDANSNDAFDANYGEYSYRPADDAAYADPRAAAAQPRTNARTPQQLSIQACLEDVHTGRRHQLSNDKVTIGRDAGNDIVVSDPVASRKHAVFSSKGSHWIIEDCGSTNGTLVNKRRVRAFSLKNGDTVTIGETDFKFLHTR